MGVNFTENIMFFTEEYERLFCVFVLCYIVCLFVCVYESLLINRIFLWKEGCVPNKKSARSDDTRGQLARILRGRGIRTLTSGC